MKKFAYIIIFMLIIGASIRFYSHAKAEAKPDEQPIPAKTANSDVSMPPIAQPELATSSEPSVSDTKQAEATPTPARTGNVDYEVKAGDTASTIAQRFGITTATVLSANSLSETSLLKLGQKLTIPPTSITVAAKPTERTKTVTAVKTKKSTAAKTRTVTASASSGGVVWSKAALRELNRAPSFIRGPVRAKFNSYAKSHGIHIITKELYLGLKI